MKVAIIPPLGHTELAQGDYHLILPQLIDTKRRNAYKLFYQETGGYKILDNGAAENSLVDVDHLMEVARQLKVDEIVVPDVLGDAAESYKLARAFSAIAKDYSWFNFMGVVQGRDRAEIIQSIHLLMDTEYITTLAIPRHLCEKIHKYVRYDVVSTLHDQLVERFEAVHFLGSSNWPKEPVLLADLPIARGMDTSFPVYMGMKGLPCDTWEPRPRGYFKKSITEHEELVRDNIERYRFWAS